MWAPLVRIDHYSARLCAGSFIEDPGALVFYPTTVLGCTTKAVRRISLLGTNLKKTPPDPTRSRRAHGGKSANSCYWLDSRGFRVAGHHGGDFEPSSSVLPAPESSDRYRPAHRDRSQIRFSPSGLKRGLSHDP